MTHFKKPALLAGGLAAALLLSTGIASAAPVRDGYHHATHAQYSHDHDRRDNDRRDNDRHDNDRHDNDRHFDRDHHGYYRVNYDRARYRDAWHRPPLRVEYRGYAPHRGMYWRTGEWRWQDGQWVWFAGTWLMAAAILSH